MRLLATILTLIPFFVSAQRGDQINFQEMRGDTIVLQGNYPAVANSDDVYLFRWEFHRGGEKVAEYTGNTPYMLAVIDPGFYQIRRYTLSVSRSIEFSKSNQITVGYLAPTIYDQWEFGKKQ